MQVDLFEPSQVTKMNQKQATVRARKYGIKKIYSDLNGLEPYFQGNHAEMERVRGRLLSLAREPRKYVEIGGSGRDNLYELETLGIAEFSKNYVMIMDFSLALDYVLHRLYKCKMEDIRKIEDYDLISSAILNCSFDNVDSNFTFQRLMSVSDELAMAVARLSEKAKENTSLPINKQVSWMVYQFYKDILSELNRVKFYAMMMVCSKIQRIAEHKGVIRSESFSTILATTDVRINEMVELVQSNRKEVLPYGVSVRSYAPFEYMGEVVRKNEFAWRI